MATIFKRGGREKRKGRYYIAYFDHAGKRQVRSARTTDKATAERIAAKLEADAALRRDGVIDAQLDSICQQSKRTIESHLEDFQAKMVAANRSPKHIDRTIDCIRAIATGANFRTVSNITADGVNRFVLDLKRQGLSARTICAYVIAVRGFTKWLVVHNKLQRDPLASLHKPNPATDRRRRRRMLLLEEFSWLRRTTLQGSARLGMTPRERVLLYSVAIQTGLRSGELRSLTRGCLYLDQNPPFILCKAGSTKNRKDARQYVQPSLAREMREYISTKVPRSVVFRMPDESSVADMLRADLADAREAWLDEARDDPDEHGRRVQSDFLLHANHEGEVLDFHALRHTCGAWLAMVGVHPKTVQSVMRHSTITLTMDTYGHMFPGQEAEAVSRLPDMLAEPSKNGRNGAKRSRNEKK